LKCLQEDEEDMAADGAADFSEKEVAVMPGFDGTGPMGAGSMTGGARGFCNPAYAVYGPAYGRGFGCGRGYGRGVSRGRGARRGFGPAFGMGRGSGRGLGGPAFYPMWGAGYAPAYGPYTMNPQDEAGMLRDEAEYMKQELAAIQKRLEELEPKSPQP
jgi:Family of unknown function (DUF5320)